MNRLPFVLANEVGGHPDLLRQLGSSELPGPDTDPCQSALSALPNALVPERLTRCRCLGHSKHDLAV